MSEPRKWPGFVAFCFLCSSVLCLFLCLSVVTVSADAQTNRELLDYARAVLQQTIGDGPTTAAPSSFVPPPQAGLFVTLVKNRKVRGCYGSLTADGRNLLEQVREYTIAAATRDFRNAPVRKAELKDIVIILSFIGPLEPVSQIQQVDPKTEGLLVRSGNHTAVLLPGEARTASWQLTEAKRQAGIGSGESVEMFKIHTVTVYEKCTK